MKISSIIILLIFLALNGASAETWVDEEALRDVESITLLPIVLPADVEFKQQQKALDASRKQLSRHLALKGYVLDTPRNWTPPERWTYENMKDMSPADIALLAPASSDHFVVGFIDSVASSNKILTSKADVRVSAKIINRKTGEVVWDNSESRMTSEIFTQTGGLFVMMFTDDELTAVYHAFTELFEELPDKEY